MRKVREEAVKMFMALMFTLLPLYYTDNYYNILHDKRDVYELFSGILLAVVAATLLISLILTVRHHRLKENVWQEIRRISMLDILMVASGIVAIVSTVYSADVAQAVSGEAAWDVGALTIVLSVVIYFVISRCYSGKGDIWAYLYFGSFAVLAIGIIDRLGYDFLVMHDEIPLQYNIFISTIGNVGFWASYLSMMIPFFMLLPVVVQSRWKSFFIYLYLLAAYFSLFITLTNTTYLGVGVASLFIICYSLAKVERLPNLAINGILFSVAGAVAEFLWKHPSYLLRPIDTDDVSWVLLQHRLYVLPGIVGVLLILYLLILRRLPERIQQKLDYFVEQIMTKIWIELIIIGVVGVVYYLIYNYNLRIFNYRGSIWYFAYHGFLDGDLWQKLFGVGPGLLDLVTQAQIAKADFYVEWNYIYCTAHNDLLEYLVTTGVIGAVCRLVMYVLPFIMYAKGREKQPEKAAVLAALVGFIGQGLLTGPYILTYVFYTIFLGVLAAYDRMGKAK